MHHRNTETDDMALAQLRADFPGHRIWRAKRWDGSPGDWMATLHDPAAGTEPTVMRPDAVALREALEADRALARTLAAKR